MKDVWDKVLGLTLVGLVLFYIFKDTSGSVGLLRGITDLYTGGLKTLQGR